MPVASLLKRVRLATGAACVLQALTSCVPAPVPTYHLENASGQVVACTGIGWFYFILEGENSMDRRDKYIRACTSHGFDHGVNPHTSPFHEVGNNRDGHIPAVCGG